VWVADENGPLNKYKGKPARGHYIEYDAGATASRVKLVVFNPGSGDHIADRLGKMRGWQPSQFGNDGKASVTEEILESLPWPEVRSLVEYMTIEKRLGQIAEGKEAWLKHATKRGIYGNAEGPIHRIHGVINTNGAVTGRMTHSKPNVAQVPKADKVTPYGKECRECFIATPGLVLIGCDAEGIELRMMAHYMHKWDGGEYGEAVANGKKEDGTDAHSINKRALGFNSRDKAKTWFYAFVYGAGDYKLGLITLEDFTDEQKAKFYAKNDTKRKRAAAIKRLGRKRRDRILEGVPALGKLVKAVKKAAKRGYLKGLDGRRLHVRAEHSALNTLLQSGGAVVMKRALVMFEDDIAQSLRSKGATVEYVANVHDEFQIESEEENAESIGKGAAESIKRAGEFYQLKCPLAGSYGVGASWAATH
jgi:DNA polymerase I - 3''-5'' exonuclease and polymerase domains